MQSDRQSRRIARSHKDLSPVSNSLLSRMYRASPDGLALLIKTVPPQTRAALAVYCLHNERLSAIGLTIAESCERRDLLCQGGSAVLKRIHDLTALQPSLQPISGSQQAAS
jgi:hypothetical protein